MHDWGTNLGDYPRTHPARHSRNWLMVLLGILFLGQSQPALGGSAAFTEEAAQRGLNYVANNPQSFGFGIGFIDLDDDGDPDVVTLGGSGVGLFENDGIGHFTNRSQNLGGAGQGHSNGVAAADYDLDGDLDLYISRPNENQLFENVGNLLFANVTATAGVGGGDYYSHGCSWGDYDLDGYPDLIVSNRIDNIGGDITPTLLYRNLGNGQFEERSIQDGVDVTTLSSFQATFFDYDRDADPDLYVIGMKAFCATQPQLNQESRLYENVGGSFIDVTSQTGADACEVDSMSIALGDFIRNGFQDIYITNIPAVPGGGGGHALLLHDGVGGYIRAEDPSGTRTVAEGWGATFIDYDNNGWLDLYVCNRFPGSVNNNLYVHNGSFPCNDLAATLGIEASGQSYAVAHADVDLDGDIDLLVGNYLEATSLFINQLCNQKNWLRLDVIGETGRHALNATADVRTGTIWQMAECVAGSNYMSQNELILHIGVNTSTVIDEVVVTWPGGTTRTLTAVPANLTLPVYPPNKLGDANRDGMVDSDDIPEFVGLLLAATIGVDDLALTDMTGDMVLDGNDIASFVDAIQ